jgi:ankyrin repeat protein
MNAIPGYARNLMEIYGKMLNSRPFQHNNPHDHHVMLRAFAWVLYSFATFSVSEIALAAVIDPEDGQVGIKNNNLLASEDYILDICGPFLEVDRRRHWVTFAHPSMRYYLRSPYNPGVTQTTYLDYFKCHQLILNTCLKFLSEPLFSPTATLVFPPEAVGPESDSLMPYAFHKWYEHASRIESTYYGCASLCRFFGTDKYVPWARHIEHHRIKMRCHMFQPVVQTPTEGGRLSFTRISGDREILPGKGLYYAALLGFSNVVTMLLERGDDPNEKGGELLYPIVAAAQNAHKEVVVQLVEAGANVNACDADNETALHVAVRAGVCDLIDFLLRSGADRNSTTQDGLTPLHLPTNITYPHVRIPGTLLKDLITDENKDEEDKSGMTPLGYAILTGRFSNVLGLIEAGCDINKKVMKRGRMSYLVIAARSGIKTMVELFLSKGLDPNVPPHEGLQPWCFALLFGYLDIVTLLLSWMSGAKTEIQNFTAETILTLVSGETVELGKGTVVMSPPVFSPLTDIVKYLRAHLTDNPMGWMFIGVAHLQNFWENGEPEEVDAARAAWDKAIGMVPQNAQCKKLKDLVTVSWCSVCEDNPCAMIGPEYIPIEGVEEARSKYATRPDIIFYTRSCCAVCFEKRAYPKSWKNFMVVPSQEWIVAHLDPEEAALELEKTANCRIQEIEARGEEAGKDPKEVGTEEGKSETGKKDVSDGEAGELSGKANASTGEVTVGAPEEVETKNDDVTTGPPEITELESTADSTDGINTAGECHSETPSKAISDALLDLTEADLTNGSLESTSTRDAVEQTSAVDVISLSDGPMITDAEVDAGETSAVTNIDDTLNSLETDVE